MAIAIRSMMEHLTADCHLAAPSTSVQSRRARTTAGQTLTRIGLATNRVAPVDLDEFVLEALRVRSKIPIQLGR